MKGDETEGQTGTTLNNDDPGFTIILDYDFHRRWIFFFKPKGFFLIPSTLPLVTQNRFLFDLHVSIVLVTSLIMVNIVFLKL